MGTSQLVMLINAGMCKAAATLIKCGGCIGKEQELGKLDLSEYDWSSYDGYMSYERINYENDVRHLKTVVADAIAKSEEIPSLAFTCRETIRKHLLCCAGGAEIESMISFLQIPQTLKSFLSLRDYTFEHEIIEVIERFVKYSDEILLKFQSIYINVDLTTCICY